MRVASWRVITVTSSWVTLAPKLKPGFLAGAPPTRGLAAPPSPARVVTMRPRAMSFWRACSSLAASILPEVWAPLRSIALYL